MFTIFPENLKETLLVSSDTISNDDFLHRFNFFHNSLHFLEKKETYVLKRILQYLCIYTEYLGRKSFNRRNA